MDALQKFQLSPSEVLYMETVGVKRCDGCAFWVQPHNRCSLLGPKTPVLASQVCGLFTPGPFMTKETTYYYASLDPRVVGLGPGDTNCGNCRYGGTEVCAHPALEKFPIDNTGGCCNAWTRPPDRSVQVERETAAVEAEFDTGKRPRDEKSRFKIVGRKESRRPLRETVEEDAATRAADKTREWLTRRVADGAMDIARLFRSSRDQLVQKVRQIYDNYLKDEPTIVRARQVGATVALDRIVQEHIDALTSELGQKSVDLIGSMAEQHPTVVNKWIGSRLGFEARDVPKPYDTVLGELTTAIIGGGTYQDRLLHINQGMKDDIYSSIRQSLISGSDFQTLSNKVMSIFGVDNLAEPKSNAYGSVNIYKNEARRQWNALMSDTAKEAGKKEVWYAELDENTTPGCAARHGVPLDELNDTPPRHYNCRCEILVVENDADLADLQAEGDAWLENEGWARDQAYVEESWVPLRQAEYNPTMHRKDGNACARESGTPEGAKKGWATRKGVGGGVPAKEVPEEYKHAVELIKKAGATFNGVQSWPDREAYLVFTDNKTGSTLMLPANSSSWENIKAKVDNTRAEFGKYKKESVRPVWGKHKLILMADRMDYNEVDPLYAYGSVKLRRLPEVAYRGGVLTWAQSIETARKYAEPDSVPVRAPMRFVAPKPFVSRNHIEVLTEIGWEPIRGKKGTWIEVEPGAWALDGPSKATWTTKLYKPSKAVLSKYPNLEGLRVRAIAGTVYRAAVTDQEDAKFYTLLASTGNDSDAPPIAWQEDKNFPALIDRLLLKDGHPGSHLLVWQVPEGQRKQDSAVEKEVDKHKESLKDQKNLTKDVSVFPPQYFRVVAYAGEYFQPGVGVLDGTRLPLTPLVLTKEPEEDKINTLSPVGESGGGEKV